MTEDKDYPAKSIEDQIKAVGREIGIRENVYPRRIKQGILGSGEAEHEIACMMSAYKSLKRLQRIDEYIDFNINLREENHE